MEKTMKAAVKVLLDAIKERGLSICIDSGKAVLRGKPSEVTPELITAMKHFRIEILEAHGINEEIIVEEPEPEKPNIYVPPGATIIVADEQAYQDKAMNGPPYTWTYIDNRPGAACAPTWWYVSDYAVPETGEK